MDIKKFTFNMFGENTYVVWDPQSHEAMVVDPGMFTPQECDELDRFIQAEGLTVKYVAHTHMHLDHAFGTRHMIDTFGATPKAHKADFPLGRNLQGQARMFGIPVSEVSEVQELDELRVGDVLTLGEEQVDVIPVPGHSPGGVALYVPSAGFVITGDSLFRGSIGRTDLPGGNYATLIHAVTDNLLTLPDATVVYPGHGPATTIADEKQSNPYL